MVPVEKTIRVALLGVDDSTAAITRALCAKSRFRLNAICEADDESLLASDEVRARLEGVRRLAEWDALLDVGVCDAVIIARGSNQDLRAEQLRKFTQVDKPVLISHPVVDSMLIYYELDMIRRETNAPLVPYLSARLHPALQKLAEFVRRGESSPLGKVEHLTIERCLSAPTKESVAREFARDVDLVRAIAGEMTRLGAMAGQAGAPNFSSLAVHMSGPMGVDARWSVVPIQSSAGAKLTLTGPRGTATVQLRSEAPWSLEIATSELAETHEFRDWDAATVAVEQLKVVYDTAQADLTSESATWVDACRAIELTETIDRSLKKSRTVELYYEDYTEDATFKGTMASVGCGLLILTLFVLAMAGVAEQMHIPYVGAWRYVLLGAFVVFLLVQLIMFTSSKRAAETVKEASDEGVPIS